MSRKPVSHSRPAALASLHSVGRHLWGCIIGKVGKPEIDDSVALQRYVDLRAKDPSVLFCEAVRRVSASQADYERLRKKIPRLESRGQLPTAQSEADQMKLADEAFHRIARQREVAHEAARMKLADAEAEAKALGFDISPGVNLLEVRRSLERHKESLDLLRRMDYDAVFSVYSGRGITDADEVSAAYRADIGKLPGLMKAIELLRTIGDLRFYLGVREDLSD